MLLLDIPQKHAKVLLKPPRDREESNAASKRSCFKKELLQKGAASKRSCFKKEVKKCLTRLSIMPKKFVLL
jgi:hypothetical protein